MTNPAAGTVRPASTILLLRDGCGVDAIEVFMMVRHYEIDFASGALVFPGGSVEVGDQDIIARPELYAGSGGLDAATLNFRIAAYAHWITPEKMPKRFDTWSFLAQAPKDQVGAHDGKESTDSIWVSPREALEGGDSGRFKLPFPTTRNLIKLGKQLSVAAALEDARKQPIVTVMPVMTRDGDKRRLRIPAEAGYDGELFEV